MFGLHGVGGGRGHSGGHTGEGVVYLKSGIRKNEVCFVYFKIEKDGLHFTPRLYHEVIIDNGCIHRVKSSTSTFHSFKVPTPWCQNQLDIGKIAHPLISSIFKGLAKFVQSLLTAGVTKIYPPGKK